MELADFFSQANADYIEQLYRQYQKDPNSVDERWSVFFAGFEAGGGGAGSVLETLLSSQSGKPAEGILHLVHSFRELGHLQSKINPLEDEPTAIPLLQLSEFGFSDADLDRQVVSGGYLGPYNGTLGGLVESLKATYCGTLAVEYVSISDKTQRQWLQERMEPTLNQPEISPDEKKQILYSLCQSEGFEVFLHTKYVGQKRFSVQGAEALIPLLDRLIEEGGNLGAKEFLMGMAHRGRLNVLAHVLNKPYQIILREFEGTMLPREEGVDGDVKYHLGYSKERDLRNGERISISLSPNPSHLELVNPVVEGMVRAKQFVLGDKSHQQVVPILIHGEAAVTGQGIVPETLSLSELKSYKTGGTVHVIINNQVGFTAYPEQTRFTRYPTDFARVIQTPVFHVNANDPEAVVHASRLAIEFRQQFGSDVFIDLWGYRRYGHNEADDPTFTQPLMYRRIDHLKSVRDIYAERLINEGVIGETDFEEMKNKVKAELDQAFEEAHSGNAPDRPTPFHGFWEGFVKSRNTDWNVDTHVEVGDIEEITRATCTLPETFTIHPKLKRLIEAREQMGSGQKNADWACAEMWALGSLLLKNTCVRMTGQDVERGTFSHRHSVLHDYETGEIYVPLQNLSDRQGKFTIVNTMLSELAVLGYEYGYSVTDPRNLVIWEAQFGDFVNGAQPIIDQFISAAETKWEKMSGLVMLLPHGYEGQGPEHSSARLERFLQLCAENNLQVCYPTLPAQYFHLLRRQMLRRFRKPLVLMMPKSLLRDEKSSSKLEEFTTQVFHPILDDTKVKKPAAVERIVLCSGKVYFTLDAARKPETPVALVRVEQLYPFPADELKTIFEKYTAAKEVYWTQEEPKNMGGWTFVEPRVRALLPEGKTLSYHGRKEAASPANGIHRIHVEEEKAFVRDTFQGYDAVEPAPASK